MKRDEQDCILYSINPRKTGNLLVETKFNKEVPLPDLYSFKWNLDDNKSDDDQSLYLYAEKRENDVVLLVSADPLDEFEWIE